MDYECIKYAILKVYKDCNIKSFPIDCFEILNAYDLKVYSYDALPDNLKEYCMKFSEDAINFKNIICYNNNLPTGRIRFSLMHELGHVILKHNQIKSNRLEQEANFFASNILAPRMAIHYSKCKDPNSISRLFGITHEAAKIAFEDYMRWYKRIAKFKMSRFDKALYTHFYNSDVNRFVYNIKRCAMCDTLIYNSKYYVCDKCYNYDDQNINYFKNDDLLIAESQWLYGGL